MSEFNCHPVFLGAELKTNFYKSEPAGQAGRAGPACGAALCGGAAREPGAACWAVLGGSESTRAAACRGCAPAIRRACVVARVRVCPAPAAEFCKQQLWPILHYLIPLSPNSLGRFDPNLWSAYVRANMAFANKLVEVRAAVQLHVPHCRSTAAGTAQTTWYSCGGPPSPLPHPATRLLPPDHTHTHTYRCWAAWRTITCGSTTTTSWCCPPCCARGSTASSARAAAAGGAWRQLLLRIAAASPQ